MKLRTLAIAVAMASVATAAQADLKISGDFGVGYMKGQAAGADASIGEWGSEINLDASEKVGGVTYMGHMELDVNALDGTSLRVDEVRVGAKGGFGEVWVGHVDNGCNQLDISADQTWWTGQNGAGCKGATTGNIMYKRGMGPATMAISHNPDADETTIGLAGNVGKYGVSLGYEDLAAGSNTVLGLKAGFGPVTVYADYNVQSLNATPGSAAVPAVLAVPGNAGTAAIAAVAPTAARDAKSHGINIYYSANGINAYVGAGENDGVGYTEAGIGKTIGMTDFILELNESDTAGSETGYLLGMRHRF